MKTYKETCNFRESERVSMGIPAKLVASVAVRYRPLSHLIPTFESPFPKNLHYETDLSMANSALCHHGILPTRYSRTPGFRFLCLGTVPQLVQRKFAHPLLLERWK